MTELGAFRRLARFRTATKDPHLHPFDGLDGHLAGERTAKPRASGLTMVIDWGIGPQRQRDLTDMGADHFDFAKIAVGLSRLHPPGC